MAGERNRPALPLFQLRSRSADPSLLPPVDRRRRGPARVRHARRASAHHRGRAQAQVARGERRDRGQDVQAPRASPARPLPPSHAPRAGAARRLTGPSRSRPVPAPPAETHARAAQALGPQDRLRRAPLLLRLLVGGSPPVYRMRPPPSPSNARGPTRARAARLLAGAAETRERASCWQDGRCARRCATNERSDLGGQVATVCARPSLARGFGSAGYRFEPRGGRPARPCRPSLPPPPPSSCPPPCHLAASPRFDTDRLARHAGLSDRERRGRRPVHRLVRRRPLVVLLLVRRQARPR